MKSIKYIFILIVILSVNFQNAIGAENDYGNVKAWFNGRNATVEGVELKVGETAEVKVEIVSKISGHVFVEISEPGVTKAFDIISGPSKQDERIDNLDISSGWSKTFNWEIKSNGAWKNGNAPINIFISFYSAKKNDQKSIQFTIANPYILDEKYKGAVPTQASTSSLSETRPPSSAKASPSLMPAPVLLLVLLAGLCRMKRS